MKFDWGKIGLFAGGVLFGTAGISVLTSRDAKKAYTHVTAAALRGKDKVMETVDKVRENADDILADAKAINEKIVGESTGAIEDKSGDCLELPEGAK